MIKYCFLLFLIIATFACNKQSTIETPPATKENILNANARIVDSTSIVAVDSASVTLLQSAKDSLPKTGDILLAAPTVGNPYGFLRKVVTVSNRAGKLVCTTVQSNLNDAFKQLSINYSHKDSFNRVTTFGEGSNSGTTLEFNFNSNNTLVSGIELNGKLQLNIPEYDIQYEKQSGSVLPKKIVLSANINTNGSSLSIKNSNNLPNTKTASLLLKEIYGPPIEVLIPVGPIIIPVFFTQKFSISILPLSVSGKLKWESVPEISATIGAEYLDGNWQDLSSFTNNSSAAPPSISDFVPNLSVSAKATLLKMEYEVSPYGLTYLTASLSASTESSLTIQTKSPNYEIKMGEEMEGSIKQEFWLGASNEYTITKPLYETSILTGDFSRDKIVKISGDNQTDSSGNILKTPIKVQVVDSATNVPQAGVTVNFTVAANSGTVSSASYILIPIRFAH